MLHEAEILDGDLGEGGAAVHTYGDSAKSVDSIEVSCAHTGLNPIAILDFELLHAFYYLGSHFLPLPCIRSLPTGLKLTRWSPNLHRKPVKDLL